MFLAIKVSEKFTLHHEVQPKPEETSYRKNLVATCIEARKGWVSYPVVLMNIKCAQQKGVVKENESSCRKLKEKINFIFL